MSSITRRTFIECTASAVAAAAARGPALGAEKVQSEDFILSSYARDAGLFYYSPTRPACVVLPQSRDEVQKIIYLANKY